jgi:hypothetical protein
LGTNSFYPQNKLLIMAYPKQPTQGRKVTRSPANVQIRCLSN